MCDCVHCDRPDIDHEYMYAHIQQTSDEGAESRFRRYDGTPARTRATNDKIKIHTPEAKQDQIGSPFRSQLAQAIRGRLRAQLQGRMIRHSSRLVSMLKVQKKKQKAQGSATLSNSIMLKVKKRSKRPRAQLL